MVVQEGGREGERSWILEDHLGICCYDPSEVFKTNEAVAGTLDRRGLSEE